MTLVRLPVLFALTDSLTSHVAGYVQHFIFEAAKISQLFCHQIIWNMKANCYKDDMAEVVSLVP